MANQFKLPDLGEGLHEAEITELLVKKGDVIKEGDPLMVVETDKASVEIPSPYNGVIQEIHVAAGDVVEVGTVLVTFNGEGQEAAKPLVEQPGVEEKSAPSAMPEKVDVTAVVPTEQKLPGTPATGAPVAAAPTTRQLAREMKIDIRLVPGSGPGGRITDDDVRRFAQTGLPAQALPEQPVPAATEPETVTAIKPPRVTGEQVGQSLPSLISEEDIALPDFSAWGEIQQIPLRSVRRAVAKKMTVSWSQIPHVSHHDNADITELEKLRTSLKGEVEGGLTLTVFIIKAVVAALKKHPNFNSSLDTEKGVIIQKHFYNIGIAVDTERGLIVPVIRDADRKTMTELSVELNDLVKRTREDKNTLEELQRGTFTITNAGVLGGTHFEPIINYPQVAILGASRASWQPVVRKDELDRMEIVPRYILPLVVTFDHRVLDGGDGARFLSTILQILETPEKMLLNI
ncbi:MAG: 2-oxo acid dehydrogenase subunit E2 [Chloroflexi bacterium]|nr:2-oxo acid dehydrogenase subunit E2 [Chloroflexota bacterium]